MSRAGQSFLMRLLDVTLYLLGRAFFTVIQAMTVDGAMMVARAMGSFGFVVLPGYRRQALANLDLAYGESLTRTEKRRIARESFGHLVSVAVELAHLPRLSRRKDFWSRVVLKDEERLRRILSESKKGLFFVTGHVGNWELSGYAAALKGFDFYAVARGRETPLLDRYMMDMRESSGMKIIYKEGAMRRMVTALRTKGIIGFLIDQNAGRYGVLVKFFGHDVSAFPTVAHLASKFGCPVIPAYSYREGKRFRYTIEIGDPIEMVATGDRDADMIENTQRMLFAIEGYVRRHPSQWLWAHRRWRVKESWLKRGRLAASAAVRDRTDMEKKNAEAKTGQQAD